MIVRVALLAALAACSPPPRAPAPAPAPPLRPRIVAHRGASFEAPENTLAAFERAWALGVEAVELDVRLTRDGEVVVFHDETTERIGGVARPVAAQTLAELRALDVGAWKHARYAGARIPTLAEVLAITPPGRTVVVEIKSEPRTAPPIAAAIRAALPADAAVALQGYDPTALAALSAALPGAAAYWTVDPPLDDRDQPLPYPPALIDEATARGFAGLALDYRGASDDLLARARDAGLLVDVWTLNEAPLLAAWAARDVRWIETDRPELHPAGPR